MILWIYIAVVAVIFAGTAVAWCWLQADTGCHAAERDVPGDLASLIRVTAVYAAIRLRARIPVVRTASPDGTACAPAARAVPLAEDITGRIYRPGSAGLPNLDHVLPVLRARLGSGHYTPPAVTGLTGEMPALTGGERS